MDEKEYELYWNEQMRSAYGQRLEMLQRDLTGTKLLLEAVLLPVFGTFESLIMEYEMARTRRYMEMCSIPI